MTPKRYSHLAMTLHWLIALALIFQMALGWSLEDIPKGPALFTAFQLHKSVGITILLLSLVRLALRFTLRRPAPLPDARWAHRLASGVHALLYVVMIAGPITGWILVSTAKVKVPTLIFGVLPWPHLPVGPAWHEGAEGAHGLLAAIGFFLILGHILGALRHQFLRGDDILARMLPVAERNQRQAAIGAAAAIALLGLAFAYGRAGGGEAATGPETGNIAQENALDSAVNAEVGDGANADLNTAENAADNAVDNAAEAANVAEGNSAANAVAAMPLSGWTVASGGKLGFTANWTGTAIDGSFSRWTSQIRFSPDALAGSSIKVTIDLASARTGDSQRDEMLQGSDFFNTGATPSAVFQSSSITHQGGDRYQAKGTLALAGQSRPVTLAFTLKIAGDTATVRGSTALQRTAFGVGKGEWAATDQIADRVAVSFAFTARRD